MRTSPPFRTLLLATLAVLALAAGGGPVAAQTAEAAAEVSRGPSWRHRVLTAVGGAALGAGVGFFASQIARSDWSERPGVSTSPRGTWAAVGAGVGLSFGIAFPVSFGSQPQLPPVAIPGRRDVLGGEELAELTASNLYEAVRILRPEWLNLRGANVFGDNAVQPLPVYLDDFRLGGVESLRGVSLLEVELVRFVPAGTATARWGIGHPNGALQVVTAGADGRAGNRSGGPS